jgi:hypothetical protein
MATLSEATAELFKTFGGPPDDVLDQRKATGAIISALAFYDQKLAQAGKRRASANFEIDPDAKDVIIAQTGFTDASTVERRIDFSDDIWEPVELVDVHNLSFYERTGDFAVAFYGYPEIHAKLSWNPVDVYESHLRIWYFAPTIIPGPLEDSFLSFPNFLDMIVAKAAARPTVIASFSRAGEPWRTLYADVMKVLIPQLSEWEQLFDVYLYQTNDESPGQFSSSMSDRGSVRRFRRVGF